ncbi:(2Fe-2S)-binding protein [Bosea sp. 2KB_26]|uniref:(2Fe-2S)-binding protein n=1 Tax=Bosea sp. 2KB_26 TaxID=3237475 RepID=UPI003F8F6FD4
MNLRARAPQNDAQNHAPKEIAVTLRTLAPDEKVEISLGLNGRPVHIEVDAATTLLDLLRNHLALTGTKKGCDHGQCGACTVLIDGERMNSCLKLAVMLDGSDITTIEGLAEDGALHPMQRAFIERDAFQCGYCTPGQICSAVALVAEGRAHSRDEIRELMSGNICRCGAYPNIVDAIEDVIAQQTGHMREAAE